MRNRKLILYCFNYKHFSTKPYTGDLRILNLLSCSQEDLSEWTDAERKMGELYVHEILRLIEIT